MGRPINKKFFGNRNVPPVGGEGVASVTLSTSTLVTTSSAVTVSFAAPQLLGGSAATGSAVKTGSTVTSVTILSSGGGYTSAPTVTFTYNGTNVTNAGTAVLTIGRPNSIVISAFISTGTSAVAGDIIKQESTARYLVTTAQGVGACKLVAAAPAAGELTFTATDSDGGTYYVTKLTSRKARLIKGDRSGVQFTSGTLVAWTLGTAIAGVSVTLESN